MSNISSTEVVSELLSEGDMLIKNVTNDKDTQLRVTFAEEDTTRTREDFKHFINKVVSSFTESISVDFIDADGEYIAVISL